MVQSIEQLDALLAPHDAVVRLVGLASFTLVVLWAVRRVARPGKPVETSDLANALLKELGRGPEDYQIIGTCLPDFVRGKVKLITVAGGWLWLTGLWCEPTGLRCEVDGLDVTPRLTGAEFKKIRTAFWDAVERKERSIRDRQSCRIDEAVQSILNPELVTRRKDFPAGKG